MPIITYRELAIRIYAMHDLNKLLVGLNSIYEVKVLEGFIIAGPFATFL
jgi:hypothetical protein